MYQSVLFAVWDYFFSCSRRNPFSSSSPTGAGAAQTLDLFQWWNSADRRLCQGIHQHRFPHSEGETAKKSVPWYYFKHLLSLTGFRMKNYIHFHCKLVLPNICICDCCLMWFMSSTGFGSHGSHWQTHSGLHNVQSLHHQTTLLEHTQGF